MQQRIDVTKVSPAAFQAVAALQSYVDQSGLDPKLRELIKIRASQINGCAYCLAMHTRDARKHGETDERMHLLNAWRETPLYTRPRTRGTGLGRSNHAADRRARSRRRLRDGSQAILGEGDRRSNGGGRCDQHVESDFQSRSASRRRLTPKRQPPDQPDRLRPFA